MPSRRDKSLDLLFRLYLYLRGLYRAPLVTTTIDVHY